MRALFFLLCLLGASFAAITFQESFDTPQADGTQLSWTKPYNQGGWDPYSLRALSGTASINVIGNATYPNDYTMHVLNGQEAKLAYYGQSTFSVASSVNFAFYFFLDNNVGTNTIVLGIQDIYNNYRETSVSLSGKTPSGTVQWVLFYTADYKNHVDLNYVAMFRFKVTSDGVLSMRSPVITSS